MKKNILTLSALCTTIFALSIIMSPSQALAATVYIESSNQTLSVGDTAVVSVKINADGAILNTVDGLISLKANSGTVAIKEFSLANSIFGIWPRTPSLSPNNQSISFVGGVPGGFSIEGATIFKMIVEAKKEGTISFSPQDMLVYANDGKATTVKVTTKDLTIKVVPKKAGAAVRNDWDSVLVADTIPPEEFIIVLGQDPTLYEGKKFAFFSAVDNQSGVSYYDVSENGAPAVRSGSSYVPKDQSDSLKLIVTAYDKAGNAQEATYPQKESSSVIWWVIGVIVALGLGFFVFKKKQRKFNASQTF